MSSLPEDQTTRRATPSSHRKVSGAIRLTAVSGPSRGRSLSVTKAVSTVGRHPTNDLVLDDPEVSNAHCAISRLEATIRVRDLGSLNGCWLGASRVIEVDLALGAEFRVGASILRVDLDPKAHVLQWNLQSFGRLVGRAAAMRDLFASLELVAPGALSVLVQGETGTGKEEVARALHEASPRASGPFVVVDATAFPGSLADSILFGHERGALPGDEGERAGLFEVADGGTLFIDELGELPLGTQAKLLRVLENGALERVGATESTIVDVRLVAATNRDLRNEVEAGRFRDDLLYSIVQVHLHLPPLRARVDDIELIAAKILEVAYPHRAIGLHPEALAYLRKQPWPGNVRELRNVLLRAVSLCTGEIIQRADVVGEGFGFRGTAHEREPLALGGTFAEAKEAAVDRFETAYFAALMRRCGGNLSRASHEADLARHYLRARLRKRGLYGIEWGDSAAEDDETGRVKPK